MLGAIYWAAALTVTYQGKTQLLHGKQINIDV